MKYEVVVGNVGTVYRGSDVLEAIEQNLESNSVPAFGVL
jgi:hypothetical protein